MSQTASVLPAAPDNGTVRSIGGVDRIFYDGYWIRYYEPPAETLAAKKELLDALTRRTFHHTEAGINTPSGRLEDARAAWQSETDPRRKRVNAAMLAGALFNRATDIFTAVVALEERGVDVARTSELMEQCARCFAEALDLGAQVKHCSGEPGVDELWGEPGKVFTMSIADYYCSRYRKVAQAMREIDRVGEVVRQSVCRQSWFDGAAERVDAFLRTAKQECEILRSDPDYFRIWPRFVADGELLLEYRADIPPQANSDLKRHIKRGTRLLGAGKDLIGWIANVRVPMPVSTEDFLRKCERYRAARHFDSGATARR